MSGHAIYVHWPFCVAKCPYCDFNSHVRERIDEARWRDALCREIRTWSERCGGPAETVFFGGGTPSLMSPDTVGAVLEEIDRCFGLTPDCEITLEANPSSVEAGRFRGYRAAGVNRLSMGIQSFDDAALKFLGRVHDAEAALAAIETARDVFGRFSFDLIYALPGQTEAAWREQLDRALGLAAGHLSLYQLTIEPNTGFAGAVRRGVWTPMDDDRAADFFELTQEICEGAGLPAYEISNHAAPGQESRHNLVYWRYGSWIGIGPGAHGRPVCSDGSRLAASNLKKPERWLEAVTETGSGAEELRPLDTAEQAEEAVMMGLRLAEGLDLSRPGAAACIDEEAAERLSAHGLIERGPARLTVRPEGRLLLNSITASLLGRDAAA
ncbi:MAG: radical SAM family heme chaperone HemW [Minwuia sp.]|uniref:radical SAM family heme chaperone HemW n=1 Tax=Minwuia sp. TaxID=2493630 RepID=UPI003A844983